MTISEFFDQVITDLGTEKVLKLIGCTAGGSAIGFALGLFMINDKEDLYNED